MNVDIQYLTDSKGKRTAVQIPYENWIELLEENQKLRELLKLKKDLSEALQEVENHQKGKSVYPHWTIWLMSYKILTAHRFVKELKKL